MMGRTGAPVTVALRGQAPLAPAVQVVLYRIAQEALNNVARHAEATQVEVDYDAEPGRARLSIRDNGCGFDVEAVTRDHFGLQNMRERAAAIGAEVEIVSQPGAGTQVTVEWREEHGDGRETGSSPDR